MRAFSVFGCLAAVALLAACASPEKRAARAQERSYEAQEDVAKKRLDLVAQYQSCVQEAAGDKMKIEACDSYLRAAEALK
jgi:hypothetical protein